MALMVATGREARAQTHLVSSEFGSLHATMPYEHFAGDATDFVAAAIDGQLYAYGTSACELTPTPVLPSGRRCVQLAKSGRRALALLDDGNVVAWPAGPPLTVVPPLPPNTQYTAVATDAFADHALYLRSDGTVVGSGSNGLGELNAPALPVGTSYVRICTGTNLSAALRSDGAVVVWGTNAAGQHVVPPLPAGTVYTAVSAYSANLTALRSDGAVVSWPTPSAVPPPLAGTSYVDVLQDQLLRSDGVIVIPATPPRFIQPTLPPGVTIREYGAQLGLRAALHSDGRIVDLQQDLYPYGVVRPLPAGRTYSKVVPINDLPHRGLALLDDGSMRFLTNLSDPGPWMLPQLAQGQRWIDISYWWDHFLALRSDGAMIGWGCSPAWNEPCTPPPLPPGVTWVDVQACNSGGVAVRSDGLLSLIGSSVVFWNYPLPVPPPGARFVEVALSPRHGLARADDGTVKAWGLNDFGQCNTPPLPAGLSYVQVAAFDGNSIALRSDGSIVVWGYNGAGQTNVPALPTGMTYVRLADSDGQPGAVLMAVRSDGQIVAWGPGACPPPPPPPGGRYTRITGGPASGGWTALLESPCGLTECPASFCAGDGSLVDHTTPCPCGNDATLAGRGCAHSKDPRGAGLSGEGSAVFDQLVLHAVDTPLTAFTLFLQHDGGGDSVFHDGVVCASGALVRLRGRSAAGGETSFPDPVHAEDATVTLSQRGGVVPGGGLVRYYSALYRNAALSFCPPASANVTNGVRVVW